MERKYQIGSATMLVSMAVRFRKTEEQEFETISVSVDYAQERVFFHGDSKPDIDYVDLEQEILAYLRPEIPSTPNIPSEIMDRVAKVRSGEYQEAFKQPEI